MVGGIGSGKTTTVVYPALQQILLDGRPAQKPSVFLVDVKGGVIDDIIVWRDEHHFTATFARHLGPAIDDQLVAIMRGWAAPSPTPSTGP